MTIGSPLGNMFGSLFGGLLLNLDGALGLAGWQWVFVATGLPAMLLFALIVKYLPDGPQTAGFIDDREKAWLANELARGEISQTLHSNPLQVLLDWRVWWFSLVYSMITLALYCVIYWLPTVVKGFGATSTQNGLLNSLPWAVVALVLLWIPRHLREHRTVLVGMAVIALCGAASFLMSTMLPENWMRYVALPSHALHLADVSASGICRLDFRRPRRRRWPPLRSVRRLLGRAMGRTMSQRARRHDRTGVNPRCCAQRHPHVGDVARSRQCRPWPRAPQRRWIRRARRQCRNRLPVGSPSPRSTVSCSDVHLLMCSP